MERCVRVCVCVWRSATWLLASCHFLLCVCVDVLLVRMCVYLKRQREREKAMGGKSKTREGEWGNVCERGGGKKGWFIPLEQSSPRQPPSHWQRSGATHRPWTHSLVQRAVDEKHTFFFNNRPRFVEKKFKCSVAAAQPRCPTLLHGKDGKQTHKHTRASKQTNPLKRIAVFIVPIVDFY